MLNETHDAFGRALLDFRRGESGLHVIERDDGYVEACGPELYFQPFAEWAPREREAMDCVGGKVLDVGCGPGRHSLHLQEKGFDVTGLDESPGMLQIATERGLKKTICASTSQVSSRLGMFDTIIMMGNNLALLGSPKRAKWLLRRFYAVIGPNGRIVGENLDPYATDRPDHLAYHERNRQRGRMDGQLRLRVRYRHMATPWFDYLFLSHDELRETVSGTGWEIERFFEGEGPQYVAILAKSH